MQQQCLLYPGMVVGDAVHADVPFILHISWQQCVFICLPVLFPGFSVFQPMVVFLPSTNGLLLPRDLVHACCGWRWHHYSGEFQ